MADWHPVCLAEEILEGLPQAFNVNGYDVCVLRHGDRYFALDDICSHAEASLAEGEQKGHIIECPRHGGQFDIETGKAVHYPAFAPVSTYPVKVEGGTIYVQAE